MVHAKESPAKWTAETIAPLLRRWDERIRAEVSRFSSLRGEAAAANSVLRPAATEAQIEAAEQRLGVRLPSAYRSFLLVSNGAYASPLGAEERDLIHGFLPAEDIAPASEADAFYVGIWTEDEVLCDPANDRRPPPAKAIDVHYFAPMRDALLISEPHEAFRSMLVPRADEEEWELWACAKEGSLGYRSFGDFLLAELASPRQGPDPTRTEEYVAEVRAGRTYALRSLAELGDPRAGELACEILGQDTPPPGWDYSAQLWEHERAGSAAHTLGLLGESRFLPALRAAYERATGTEMRRSALGALVACGAPDAMALLSAAALNDADHDVRFAAIAALGGRGGKKTEDVLQQVVRFGPNERLKSYAAQMLRGINR